jgi:hypothetical protein
MTVPDPASSALQSSAGGKHEAETSIRFHCIFCAGCQNAIGKRPEAAKTERNAFGEIFC